MRIGQIADDGVIIGQAVGFRVGINGAMGTIDHQTHLVIGFNLLQIVAEFQNRILEGLERLCNRTLQSRRVATATGHRCAFRKLSIHQPIHVRLPSIPMTTIAGPANG